MACACTCASRTSESARLPATLLLLHAEMNNVGTRNPAVKNFVRTEYESIANGIGRWKVTHNLHSLQSEFEALSLWERAARQRRVRGRKSTQILNPHPT